MKFRCGECSDSGARREYVRPHAAAADAAAGAAGAAAGQGAGGTDTSKWSISAPLSHYAALLKACPSQSTSWLLMALSGTKEWIYSQSGNFVIRRRAEVAAEGLFPMTLRTLLAQFTTSTANFDTPHP